MSDDDQQPPIRPLPFAAGMLLGSLMGFLIWMATDTFALFPAFIGIGFVLGLVFSRMSGGGPQ
ncbi:hypothetical protein [Demequina rhizosphaerae]|uniref:hypothetical protein n=1 Tax=Demequina rhizosphaerae TaxID=1638985 RepID=UPI000785DF83|nr:hypothetical protein [Demequina rhizosphaerae]